GQLVPRQSTTHCPQTLRRLTPSSPRRQPPRRGGDERPRVPAEHQTPAVLLHPVPIPAGEELQQQASLPESIRAQVDRLEPRGPQPPPPPVQGLVPLDPVRPLTGHHVAYLPREVHLCHLQVLGFGPSRPESLERVEHGGIVMEGLVEPLQKTAAVVPVKLENRVHGQRLAFYGPDTKQARIQIGQGISHHATKFELDPYRLRQLSQFQTHLFQSVAVIGLRRPDSSESKNRRAARPHSQSLNQGRPLHPLFQAEIDHVDPISSGERLENRLVGREVREFEIRPRLVKMGLQNVAVRGAEGFRRANPVDPSGQGLGEVCGHLPHGPHLRDGQHADVLDQSIGQLRVPLLYGLRARHQHVNEPHAGLLRVHHNNRPRGLLLRRRDDFSRLLPSPRTAPPGITLRSSSPFEKPVKPPEDCPEIPIWVEKSSSDSMESTQPERSDGREETPSSPAAAAAAVVPIAISSCSSFSATSAMSEDFTLYPRTAKSSSMPASCGCGSGQRFDFPAVDAAESVLLRSRSLFICPIKFSGQITLGKMKDIEWVKA
ncbi:ribosomal RNA large subunit methyltransferase E, partial [Striga asiatica]